MLKRKKAMQSRKTARNARKILRQNDGSRTFSKPKFEKAAEWSEYISRLSSRLFDRYEARIFPDSGNETPGAKVKPYERLALKEDNNLDVSFVYDLSFKDKAISDGNTCTYNQFRTVVSQPALLGVALGQVKLSELFKKGMVFKLVTKMDLVQIFLNFFLLRSAASTVMAKAKHLKRLAETSSMFFGVSRPVLQSKANGLVSLMPRLPMTAGV